MALSKKAKIATITSSIVAILIALLVTAYFLIGGFFYSLALDPDNDSLFKDGSLSGVMPPSDIVPEHSFDEHDEWFDNSGYTTVNLTSTDKRKYNLNAYQLMQSTATDNWAVLIHGYRGQALNMRYYAYYLYNMGFNVLMPDLRGHGLSEGDYIGMGWHDSDDIYNWVTNHIIKTNANSNIAILGVSMGAATTMMTTGLDLPSNVKVAVADCGYSNVYEQFAHVLKNAMGYPKEPIMSSASAVTSINAGYSLKKADSITRLQNSKTPTIFIHGDKDDFVPYYMLDKVYNACAASDKKKVTVEGAGHAQSAITNHELYWSEVTSFIGKYIDIVA